MRQMGAALAGATWGAEFASNCLVVTFTQVVTGALSIYAGNNSLSSQAYANELANCVQVGVIQHQVEQLGELSSQAQRLVAAEASLSTKLRQLRASTLVYAQSLADQRSRFRTQAAIAMLLNIYVALVLVFWILQGTQRRGGQLTHAELNLSILEAARRDAALASALQEQAPTGS